MHVEDDIVDILNCSANIAKSDAIVPDDLRDALKAAVAPLEDVPDRFKDWHPNSDEKVLDLVHPSLFPLVYGRSRVFAEKCIGLQDCVQFTGKGEVIPTPTEDQKRGIGMEHFSTKFQWLPCEVAFAKDGAVEIQSYINNLHPVHHNQLYKVLEKLLAKAIPLWNRVLSGLDEKRKPRIDPECALYDFPDGQFSDREPESDDPDEEEDEDAYLEFRDDWIRSHRIVEQPEPDEYEPRDLGTPFDLRESFQNQGFQVIIKLANIHLTPEKPKYDGGSWHVEGMLNEHICATALYYYDNENITDSHLYFRQKVHADALLSKQYEQNDSESVEVIYDVKDYGPAIQEIGGVHTKEGRVLAFPNVLQHCVGPFELADKTKPGHRKIVALFLVDPYIRVLSTANVPPQQRDWWAEVLSSENSKLGLLSGEILQHVVEDVDDFPISFNDAKVIREELMKERGLNTEKVNGQSCIL